MVLFIQSESGNDADPVAVAAVTRSTYFESLLFGRRDQRGGAPQTDTGNQKCSQSEVGGRGMGR